MADISAMVERLVSAGCDPAVAACVVAEVFTAGVLSADFRGQKVDETAERRRAKDRDRKRLEREMSADIRRNPPMSKSALTVLPSSGENPEKEERKIKRRASPLSADFQPNERHFEAAAKLNLTRQDVLDKCEDMRIWATANGATKVDWDATLHGFLRRDASKLNGKPNGKPDHRPGVAEIAKRYAEQFESQPGDGFAGNTGPILRIQNR